VANAAGGGVKGDKGGRESVGVVPGWGRKRKGGDGGGNGSGGAGVGLLALLVDLC
jgi:hypothetical protein